MRYPSLSPGRISGGGGSDDDETDSSSGSGLGGSVPGAPDDGGGSDPSTSDPDPDPPNQYRDELGGDPVDSGGRNTGGGTRPDPEPDPSPTPTTNVDETTSGGPLDNLVENTLNPAAETFDEQIAEPAGEAVRASSPATLLDSQIPGGSPVGRTVENSVRGAANVANAPGIAAGLIRAGQRAADDTARANEQGAAGRRANRRELASDVVQGATSTGAAVQEDPVGTLSRIGGGIAGGALAGGAASRAARGLRGSPDADAGGSGGSVPSGRSNPGTGGVDSILDDVDVDARRGTSGPSTRSRVEGEVSRAVDDVTDRIDDSPLGDFVEDTRAQLQQQRPSSRDTGSAPDRTRPADAGGSFEDVRQDSLTQTQDALRDQATRPNPGTFDGAPRPFRSGGGDTIDPDGGVSLQRGSGIVDDADAAAGSTSAGGSGVGTGTGLGTLSGVNDPTGIADTATAGGTALDPAQILGAGTDSTGAGAQSDVIDQLGGGRLGGGTLPGDATGTGTDTDAGTDTFDPTDTDPGTDTPTDTTTGTDDVLATTTLTGTRTDTGTSTTDATLPGSTTVADTTTVDDAILRLGGSGGGDSGAPPRPRGEEEPDQDDDPAALLGFATESAEFGSGIASGSEELSRLGVGDPFSL
jgi:hypothetical protein